MASRCSSASRSSKIGAIRSWKQLGLLIISSPVLSSSSSSSESASSLTSSSYYSSRVESLSSRIVTGSTSSTRSSLSSSVDTINVDVTTIDSIHGDGIPVENSEPLNGFEKRSTERIRPTVREGSNPANDDGDNERNSHNFVEATKETTNSEETKETAKSEENVIFYNPRDFYKDARWVDESHLQWALDNNMPAIVPKEWCREVIKRRMLESTSPDDEQENGDRLLQDGTHPTNISSELGRIDELTTPATTNVVGRSKKDFGKAADTGGDRATLVEGTQQDPTRPEFYLNVATSNVDYGKHCEEDLEYKNPEINPHFLPYPERLQIARRLLLQKIMATNTAAERAAAESDASMDSFRSAGDSALPRPFLTFQQNEAAQEVKETIRQRELYVARIMREEERRQREKERGISAAGGKRNRHLGSATRNLQTVVQNSLQTLTSRINSTLNWILDWTGDIARDTAYVMEREIRRTFMGEEELLENGAEPIVPKQASAEATEATVKENLNATVPYRVRTTSTTNYSFKDKSPSGFEDEPLIDFGHQSVMNPQFGNDRRMDHENPTSILHPLDSSSTTSGLKPEGNLKKSAIIITKRRISSSNDIIQEDILSSDSSKRRNPPSQDNILNGNFEENILNRNLYDNFEDPRELQDLREIGVVNSLANITLVEKKPEAGANYHITETYVMNKIPIPHLLVDDNSFTHEKELETSDKDTILTLKTFDFHDKSILMVQQKRGSIFIYPLGINTCDASGGFPDVHRECRFGQILPPTMRFRWHSCIEAGGFCHALNSAKLNEGILVIDRHRLILIKYVWKDYQGVERIYDEFLSDNLVRIPVMSTFGLVDLPRNGNLGLSSPLDLVVYQPHSNRYFRVANEAAFIKGDLRINNPDFKYADNTFIFVCDSGNKRIVIFRLVDGLGEPITSQNTGMIQNRFEVGPNGEPIVLNEGVNIEYYMQFQMKDSLYPSYEFETPSSIDLFLPGLEIKYATHFANVFVADKGNHRILKLNFGFQEYTYFYNVTVVDEFTKMPIGIETRSYTYKKWTVKDGNPTPLGDGPYLEYDSHYGESGNFGKISQGKLYRPHIVKCFRHYIFVQQENVDEIAVFNFNYMNTKEWNFVTKFSSQRSLDKAGFSISWNGVLLYVRQARSHGDFSYLPSGEETEVTTTPLPSVASSHSHFGGVFQKEIALTKLPRDLKESILEEKFADITTGCLEYDYYNGTLMRNPVEFERMVKESLSLAGLQYFYPNRSYYVDWTLFNLSSPSSIALQEQKILDAMTTTTSTSTPQTVGINNQLGGLSGDLMSGGLSGSSSNGMTNGMSGFPSGGGNTVINSGPIGGSSITTTGIPSTTTTTPSVKVSVAYRSGFNFALWNATIYSGLMSFCVVEEATVPPMVFGSSKGFTTADGKEVTAWDISSAKRKYSMPLGIHTVWDAMYSMPFGIHTVWDAYNTFNAITRYIMA